MTKSLAPFHPSVNSIDCLYVIVFVIRVPPVWHLILMLYKLFTLLWLPDLLSENISSLMRVLSISLSFVRGVVLIRVLFYIRDWIFYRRIFNLKGEIEFFMHSV